MSLLVNGHHLSKGFSGRTLFKKLSFGISEGQHIGLIGPNGAGKSTLLKIICGLESPDEGTFSKRQGIKIAYLPQVPSLDPDQDILTTVLDGADDPHDKRSMALAYELISKLAFDEAGLNEYSPIGTLSGGWQKKVALAREFMRQPDLLLLDEPTNHLDVDSILWLEEFLARTPFATLTITHDRLFLNRISNRIWELDPRLPNGLLDVEGDYATFCQIKEEHINALERREDVLKNTLRRETEWLRRGPAARTTKQNARIQRAHTLSDDVEDLELLNRKKNVGIEFSSADSSPKKILEARHISKSYDGRTLFEDFSLTLQRGQRIALLGANGAGKSTLIKILLGLEKPDTGEVEHSERLQVSYFDQKRDTLDPNSTPIKTLCPQGDHVRFRGSYVHIRSYLDRFLFGPDLAKSTISKLSGGEQARLLIAKLMLQECNLLVLDEPTNDLDLATLNVLEEQLREFDGAILLVTHDRYFMDQVVDQIYAPYEGQLMSFADIGQWESWVKDKSKLPKPTQSAVVVDAPKTQKTKKLSYKDQRELDQMEAAIAEAEALLSSLEADTQKPENSLRLGEITAEMSRAQSAIEKLYARWAELETMQKEG